MAYTNTQIWFGNYVQQDVIAPPMPFKDRQAKTGNKGAFISFPDHLEYDSESTGASTPPVKWISESDESTMPSTPPTPRALQMQALIQELAQKSTQLEQTQFRAQQAEERCKELEYMGHGPSTLPPQPRFVQTPAIQGYPHEAKKNDAPKPRKNKKAQQKEIPSAPPVPLPPGLVAAYSRGSKNHELGQCRPCRSFNSPEGCKDGAMCNFCHCPHDDQRHLGANIYGNTKATGRRAADKFPQKSELESLALSEPWYAPMPSCMMAPPPGLELPTFR